MKQGLVLCVRSDPAYRDAKAPTIDGSLHRPCAWCKVDLLVAPSTWALETTGKAKLTFACNPCGQAEVARRGVEELGIAPDAFKDGSPYSRRRRSELEAHGFKDVT